MRATADLFKALGDETRLRMVWLLLNQRELCVCDFMAVLDITQSKASRHLRALFHAGLVDDRREGLWVYYSLRALKPGVAQSALDTLRVQLGARPDARKLARAMEQRLARKACATGCQA